MSGQVLEFFEIVIPRCLRTYGVAPCTAAVGVTGAAKCFNCLATCQDTANFSEETKTLRFAKPTDFLPSDIAIVGPWIKSIDFTAATISLAENLGTRAVLKVVLEDHRHSDAGEGLDKYQAERGYDPYERGSFWPRFRARYPSPNGFECAWIIGEVGQALADMERRSFFVESFSGPGADGTFSITAKDALKFLDGDRAQMPVLSGGFLSAGISASATSLTLSPSGIGNTDYPASGEIRIAGNEDCTFTRSGDTMTIARAQFGSVASSHSAGDRVQLMKSYVAQAAADIIYDAITTYTDLDAARIPLAEWQLEDSTNIGTLYTFRLGEPTSVAAFVSRVLEQCGGMLWDDALNDLVRFKAIKAVPLSADVISEANVINKSFEPTDQPEQRFSRAWVYYGISNWTKRRDDLDNYRQTAKTPDDATAEANEALYGNQAIRKILADGIAVGGGTVATRVGNLVVGRKQRPPRRFKWSMLRGQTLPALGGGYYLDWRSLQDASGLREPVPVQIISERISSTIRQYVAEEMRFTDLDTGSVTDRVLLIDFNAYNLNLRDIHDQIYPSTFSGVTVTFIISAIIGSTSTAVPAIVVGDWPVGFTPTVKLTNRIQGRGGRGGDIDLTGSGAAGGQALYTRHPINLDLSEGAPKIYGGGGGGSVRRFESAWGGGGGAGIDGGNGGWGPATQGATGTADAGGISGNASYAGYGGGPGQSGTSPLLGNTFGATPGVPGAAIDGVSYVTFIGSGDIRGPQIN